MLDIKLIRDNPELVKERLTVRNFRQVTLIDELLELDESRRKALHAAEEMKANQNAASKLIGQLLKEGRKDEAEKEKASVAETKAGIARLEHDLTILDKAQIDLLLQLPNLPYTLVKSGTDAEDNETVREGGKKPSLPEGAKPHWELIKDYDLIDFETGAKITGSGFPLYKGQGAKLQRALIGYFLDYNSAAGYTEYLPPFMVNADSAYATGQLPDKEGQMYHMPEDGFYMIPTAEVPVTNIYRDTILKEEELPIKMTAYTPCFRREAGSFGANVRGLNRVHQFDKVEIIQIVHPEKSHAILDEMVAHVEKLVQSLELPYRILRLCGGDMGFTSAITYDFEVWSAAQQKWLEVSSVSNFESFQANRLRCRFKSSEGGKTQLVHTLNGSAMALPRIVAALLENNQTPHGIRLPQVLHSWFGKDGIWA